MPQIRDTRTPVQAAIARLRAELGDNLRRFRRLRLRKDRRKFTQGDMQLILHHLGLRKGRSLGRDGVHSTGATVSSWEGGHGSPSLTEVYVLSRLYGVSPGEVIQVDEASLAALVAAIQQAPDWLDRHYETQRRKTPSTRV